MAYLAGWVCEILTWVSGSTTTLSRGSVGDACSVRYASGDKAREILGYEARVGIEDAIRLSCEVSFFFFLLCGSRLPAHEVDHGAGLCSSKRHRVTKQNGR